MERERIAIFRRNLPFIVRDEDTVGRILSHPDNHFIERRDGSGELIGLSVVNRDTILLLCVDRAYRRQGVGTRALRDMGMREAYLSYTYSGLDRLYGAAGYRIKVFYMMAEKKLV